MNMLKGMEKWPAPQKVLFAILFVILIVAIFTPKSNASNILSAGFGMHGHLGNLRGNFNVETMENMGTQNGGEAVLFYAPWCGHCKKMMPEWEKLGDNVGSVKVLKVNSDENQELAQKHGVSGYPTIMYFKEGMSNGNGEVYEGEREANTLRNWISAKGVISTGPNDGNSAPENYQGVI